MLQNSLSSGIQTTTIKGMPFRPGEAVRCQCPEGKYALPNGLREGDPAKVIATYLDKTYVLHDGKSYLVRNVCIHRERKSG
jgi:nitrite reductase/ring-hydroxylating ferredoxin subunit